ncbi:hypothetical protein [uncultured Sulfitobacter sp.]|uniref:hypothetical protein n=1 Tax=uncultured Sulfitobacter sp. TaxID=191468 RepID=UPI00261233D3|nr:hypothetical protein [uncultured Sulfitobacter sp.]
MILWPFMIGGASGAILIWSLYRIGALQERSGIAVLLGAIAFFWPVFALQANAAPLVIAFHSFVLLAFAATAAYGFRHSAALLAVGIIAHGVFDALVYFAGHPGPTWWPAFCGTLDIVAGVLLLVLIRTRRIPA